MCMRTKNASRMMNVRRQLPREDLADDVGGEALVNMASFSYIPFISLPPLGRSFPRESSEGKKSFPPKSFYDEGILAIKRSIKRQARAQGNSERSSRSPPPTPFRGRSPSPPPPRSTPRALSYGSREQTVRPHARAIVFPPSPSASSRPPGRPS